MIIKKKHTAGFLALVFVVAVSFLYREFTQARNSDQFVSTVKKGDLAPEINLPNPQGETMPLSSLKGKVVLVDFWASWCGPCRRSNPGLVRLYKKYENAKFKKKGGFEIYSVSLDRSKKSWEQAIEKDNLAWSYHVSDLKFWNSEAGITYGVRSIPQTFLIDEEGYVIGHNLSHRDIEFELNKRLKKPLE